MKKIAVISDTHGSDLINKFMGYLEENKDIKDVMHLGDYYEDADVLVDAGYLVTRVPGVYSAYYQNLYVENRIYMEIYDWRFFLTHTKDSHSNDGAYDLKPEQILENKTCDIFLYGHTHKPEIKKVDDGLILLNPGHLKSEMDRGFAPSFAVLEIEKASVDMKILNLSGGCVFQDRLIKS
jgi:uncharacterized protein